MSDAKALAESRLVGRVRAGLFRAGMDESRVGLGRVAVSLVGAGALVSGLPGGMGWATVVVSGGGAAAVAGSDRADGR